MYLEINGIQTGIRIEDIRGSYIKREGKRLKHETSRYSEDIDNSRPKSYRNREEIKEFNDLIVSMLRDNKRNKDIYRDLGEMGLLVKKDGGAISESRVSTVCSLLRKEYNIPRFKVQQDYVAEMFNKGFNNTQIAKELGITERQVYRAKQRAGLI